MRQCINKLNKEISWVPDADASVSEYTHTHTHTFDLESLQYLTELDGIIEFDWKSLFPMKCNRKETNNETKNNVKMKNEQLLLLRTIPLVVNRSLVHGYG